MTKTLPVLLLVLLLIRHSYSFSVVPRNSIHVYRSSSAHLNGWVQRKDDGEWEWKEDDQSYVPPVSASTAVALPGATATPKLPSQTYKPKQSLGQNYLQDPNTVAKIIRAFHADAVQDRGRTSSCHIPRSIVELGPGAGALTDKLVETYGEEMLQCIEIDERSVQILHDKHPDLRIFHNDVLQVNYPEMAEKSGQPLVIIGNLPYYITSQILFSLADASHSGSISSATVTMQWEVAQRMVARPRTKDYGILSVVFQIYADVKCHFKIPPTVFYPKPKVDSALVGLHFLRPSQIRQRLAGVQPSHLRRVVNIAFQQRRKTIRNSLKKLCSEVADDDAQGILNAPPLPLPASVLKARAEGDPFALTQQLPGDWASKRPEELSPAQFIELTRRLFGPADCDALETLPLGNKVWRKLKHGEN